MPWPSAPEKSFAALAITVVAALGCGGLLLSCLLCGVARLLPWPHAAPSSAPAPAVVAPKSGGSAADDEAWQTAMAEKIAQAMAVEAFRERLASGKPFLSPSTMTVGDVGRLAGPVKVLQMQRDGSFLATIGAETILFTGVDSTRLVDGRRWFPGFEVFEVVGKFSYTNTLSARQTVLELRRLELPDDLRAELEKGDRKT